MFVINYERTGSMRVGPDMLWNLMWLLILVETPAENAEICSCRYIRKVSDDQRPNFLMVSRSTPLSFMAIAPPARREWLLTNLGSKPDVV